MTKKGQGISINTIIIAAIALAVLVVLFAIFTGRLGIFTKGVQGTAPTCDKACILAGYTGGAKYSGSGAVVNDCENGKFKIAGEFQDVGKDQLCCCTPK